MCNWPASKARRVLAALKIGWRVKRRRGSHQLLTRPDWLDYEFTFHDQDEIGPRKETVPWLISGIHIWSMRGIATTRQLELHDRQFLLPASLCVNTTAYLSPSGA